MALNKELIDNIITVTSKAAISCYNFIGKNQKKNADKAATDSMRNEINKHNEACVVNQANRNTAIIISLRWRSLKYPIATLTPTTSLPPRQHLHTTLASQREITTAQNSLERSNSLRSRISLRASTSAVAPEAPIPFSGTSTQNNESE